MPVVRLASPSAFLELAGPLLARDEARNNLLYGIAATVAAQPEFHAGGRFWVATRGETPSAAALVTPPHNLVVADPIDDEALAELLDAIAGDGVDLPGLVGNRPFADVAAARWAVARGSSAEIAIAEAVHRLASVHDVRRAPGSARPAGPGDREVLLGWFVAFGREALTARGGTDEETDRQMERSLDARLASSGAGSGLWLWEDDGAPVSVAGYLGKTPNGIRIGPVYTPPDHRGRGYATTLVADLSRWLLEHGNRFCFLYTDLANPTSNAIYARIGYERVCDAVEYRFVPARVRK